MMLVRVGGADGVVLPAEGWAAIEQHGPVYYTQASPTRHHHGGSSCHLGSRELRPWSPRPPGGVLLVRLCSGPCRLRAWPAVVAAPAGQRHAFLPALAAGAAAGRVRCSRPVQPVGGWRMGCGANETVILGRLRGLRLRARAGPGLVGGGCAPFHLHTHRMICRAVGAAS